MAVHLKQFEFRGASIVRPRFIETGTYEGDTLDSACKAGFGELHSIEVHEPHYLAARQRFAEVARVHLHLGTSPLVLRRIIDPAIRDGFDSRHWPARQEVFDHLPSEYSMSEHNEILYCVPLGF